MKVHSIQQQASFTSKQKRLITPKMKEGIRELLERMNSETDYNATEYIFRSEVTKSLKYGDKVKFIDERHYLGKVPSEMQMKYKTHVTIGKTKLVIDNETEEIIDYKKPFYKTWSGIMEKLGECIEFFKANYDESDLVIKERLRLQGFTEEGAKLLKW